MENTLTPAQWGEQYRERRPSLVICTEKLRDLVSDLLSQKGIGAFQLEARTKSVESFIEKLERKSGQYADPLSEMTDLVGLRVVTYYQEDVSEVCKLIESEFTCDKDNSIDKTGALAANEFGYNGVHYIASLTATRKQLPEWTQCAAIWCELQVRTALQHAWAAIEHKLNYKAGFTTTPELKRGLYRLSALLELADEEFARLRTISDELVESQRERIQRGDQEATINSSSLAAYLEASDLLQKLTTIAMQSGWVVANQSPRDQKRFDLDSDDFLKILGRSGIETFADLERAMASALESAQPLKQLLNAFEAGQMNPDASALDLASFLILGASSEPEANGADIYSPPVLAVIASVAKPGD